MKKLAITLAVLLGAELGSRSVFAAEGRDETFTPPSVERFLSELNAPVIALNDIPDVKEATQEKAPVSQQNGHGGELPSFGGLMKEGKFVDHCAVNIWGISDHNDNGTHNEHNTGLGLRCYIDKRWFLQADIVKNSLAQPTQDVVFGAEFQIIKAGDVKLLGAGSFGFIRYERPNKKEPIEGWIPVPTLVLRYKKLDVNCILVNMVAKGQRIRIEFITWHF